MHSTTPTIHGILGMIIVVMSLCFSQTSARSEDLVILEWHWCDEVVREENGGGEPSKVLNSGDPTDQLTFWFKLGRDSRDLGEEHRPSSPVYARWYYRKDGEWIETPDEKIRLDVRKLGRNSTFRTWTTKANINEFDILGIEIYLGDKKTKVLGRNYVVGNRPPPEEVFHGWEDYSLQW